MKDIFIREIAQVLQVPCELETVVTGYQIDSRKIQPGELFFALPGLKQDGHDFLECAASRGASVAIVSDPNVTATIPLLCVPDVKNALHRLARELFHKLPIPIVGITGSVGKTTTKEMVATFLSSQRKVNRSPGSYNSQLTYPLNLLNRTGTDQIFVLEMGMNGAGQIASLVDIAAPDIAVITKISLAHAKNFPDGLSGIAKAKAEILGNSKTKIVVLDLEILQQFPDLFGKIPQEKFTFSIHNPSADYYLSGTPGRYLIDERGVRAAHVALPFTEKHLLQDFMAAVAAVRQLDIAWSDIERQIPFLSLPEMRFQKFEREGIQFVNDTYNASPASMAAALEALPDPAAGGKCIALLGEMQELGEFSEEAHREMGYLAQKKIDVLLCLGKETEPLCVAFEEAKKPATLFLDLPSAAGKLREMMCPGDIVLLKGSRGMRMEQALELLK